MSRRVLGTAGVPSAPAVLRGAGSMHRWRTQRIPRPYAGGTVPFQARGVRLGSGPPGKILAGTHGPATRPGRG